MAASPLQKCLFWLKGKGLAGTKREVLDEITVEKIIEVAGCKPEITLEA